MRRRRPLLHPRSAPPAPSGTTSATHQPARLAHVRLAITRRALPVEPPQVPVLAARARRDHELLLRHQSCRRVSNPSASRRPRTASTVPSPTAGNPRAVDPPPAAAVARRIAARQVDRQTQRREHRPHPLPRPARRPPPDRVQLVHQRHQVRKPFNRGLRRPCLRLRRRAAPGTPPPRTAPAAVAPRPPRPSSRRGTRRRRPPRARTARDRGPLTRQRRSDTILPSGQSRFRPAPTCRSARRNVPSRRSPGPGPRGSLTRSTTPASPHRARRAATSSASASRSASSISSRRMRSTMKHKSPFRPLDPQRIEWQPGLRSTLDVRAGEHVGPAVRTHRRQRQPDVDRELRQAARALPRRRLPPFRRRRRQMRPQQPPHAHLSTTRRTTLSVPAAAESSQPRTSPASSAQRSASIGATTLHLQPLVEPLGGRLVGDRQQDGQRQPGPDPTHRSATPDPSAPRRRVSRPGSSSDRQRTTAPEACSKPVLGPWGPLDGHEMAESTGFNFVLQTKVRVIRSRTGNWSTFPSAAKMPNTRRPAAVGWCRSARPGR